MEEKAKMIQCGDGRLPQSCAALMARHLKTAADLFGGHRVAGERVHDRRGSARRENHDED
jgi:hypothetical protein